MSFPASPTTGQQATEGERLFQWDGYAWSLVANVTGHADTHAAGGSDPLTIASSQVTGLPSAGTGATDYCAGNDSRLSDARAPTGVAGGDLTGTYPNPTIAPGAVVTADLADGAVTDAKIAAVAASKLTGTIADARLSPAVATYALLATSAHQPSAAVDVYPRGDCANLLNAPPSGTVWITFFTPTITTNVSSITMVTGNTTAASGLTLARMGLYTLDETTATLVARCASDTSLFAATGTSYQRSFSTVGGLPSSYQLVAGTRYGVAVLCVGTTMPNIASRAVGIGVSALSPRMSASIASQTDLPTSATITTSQQTQPFARLS